MTYSMQGDHYRLLLSSDHGLRVAGGHFGSLTLCEESLFTFRFRVVGEKQDRYADSTHFRTVRIEQRDKTAKITLCDFCSDDIVSSDFSVVLDAQYDEKRIVWSSEVINNDPRLSVYEISYPTPSVCAPQFDLFEPNCCGKVVQDAGRVGYKQESNYPSSILVMFYFALYNRDGGLYLAVENPDASLKRAYLLAGDNIGRIRTTFPAINLGKGANSFRLAGQAKWEFFTGDWYDATLIYADFVYNHASWLPEIDENGRTDEPKCFRDIAYWVVDYVPASERQKGNTPRSFAIDENRYPADHWVNAALEMQTKLDVPIAYHVYNWHQNSFNVEYPHFLPAKQIFIDGVKELRKNPNIKILPYINALSWESCDAEAGHAVNYENVGHIGVATDEDGMPFSCDYPQTTVRGHSVDLMSMCPTFHRWHDIIATLVSDMQTQLDIDGIYFDQIAAHRPPPCTNPAHPHLPGGGSYWTNGYNEMMQRIRRNKPADHFHFTENNSESYVKSFDGFLTWWWTTNTEVPAFAVIYAGYIEFVGRYIMGDRLNDTAFFKYQTGRALLCGQQIGWYPLSVMDKPGWMEFLKPIVKTRQKYNDFFHRARLLRLPEISCDLTPVVTGSAGRADYDDVVIKPVISAAWKERCGDKTVLFIVNCTDEDANFSLQFKAKEYGISEDNLPDGFVLEGDICRLDDKINANSVLVREW